MWKVGDRALCITPGSRMKGLEVVISSGLQDTPLGGYESHLPLETVPHYGVDPGFPTGCAALSWGAEPRYLIPIPDSYDGLEISSWSECPIEFHPDNFKVTVDEAL